MNGKKQAMLALSFAVAMMCAAAEQSSSETTLRLAIPRESANVLMLEGLEVALGQRLTIEVLGPPDPKTKKRPLLAVEGLVGSGRRRADAPKQTMDLVVPLNEHAARLMAKKREITLTVRPRHGRQPLKFKRAYLDNR